MREKTADSASAAHNERGRDTRRRGVVQRGRRAAAGEALDVHVPARVDNVKGFHSAS